MYWYNRNWDEYRHVLYREVFFIRSVLYRRFHCNTKTELLMDCILKLLLPKDVLHDLPKHPEMHFIKHFVMIITVCVIVLQAFETLARQILRKVITRSS